MKRFILLIGFMMVYRISLFAGVPPLEMQVNLSFNNEKISVALDKIHEQTSLVFSYQPSIFNNASPITIQLKNKTVREALALILPKNIAIKPKSHYIILKEKPAEKETEKIKLSGYVYDKNTDQKIPNVTIYDKNTLQSVTTNEYGFYSITLPKNNQCLSVNKENYQDTCVSVAVAEASPINNFSINPVSDSVSVKDTANWRLRLKDFSEKTNLLFKQFKGYVNTLNVKDTFTRNFQVSLVPFVGTNGLLSANVYNKYSFNIFGGYSRGTKALELGGFFNVNREQMTGLQGAGFFNIVGDSAKGAQLGGLFNITGRQMDGFQGAGLFNFNVGKTQGLQTAGLFNLNIKEVNGVQLAGLANFNYKGIKGVSAAGIINLTRFSVKGVQLAGFVNVCADTLAGFSAAGFTNLNWYSKQSVEAAGFLNSARYGDNNVQIAGLVNNTAKGSTKLQVAGVLNRAHNLTGLQIAMFNYADSASGVPIGLLSFVKNGVHQIEISSDELFYANVSLRTGVNKFYNIFNASSNGSIWSIGYGVGTSFKLKNKWRVDVTATSNHVSSGSFYFATSQLYKFYAGVEYRLNNKISIAAGPTFNLYWSDALLPDYKTTYNNIAPYYLFNKNLPNDFNLKGWCGAKLAVRFF